MPLIMRVMCGRVSQSVVGLVAMLFLLAACVSHNHAPVRDLEKPRKVTWGSHRVIKGDTLYSIAWRYGWDYQALARANQIKKPYLLMPGQIIYLNRKATTASRKNSPQQAVATKPSERKRASATKTKPPSVMANSVLRWSWPAKGPLIQTFSKWGASKGIDIAIEGNSAVRSAADGVVVYAGNGLIGYGNLIIIKHNATYLSAYANNRKILVGEQKKVKVGEKIAEISSSRARKASLHFEIRKHGIPVDPLIYLPKSKS